MNEELTGKNNSRFGPMEREIEGRVVGLQRLSDTTVVFFDGGKRLTVLGEIALMLGWTYRIKGLMRINYYSEYWEVTSCDVVEAKLQEGAGGEA